MRRVCRASDPNIGDGDLRCGLVFDDVERSTVCPHRYLNGYDPDRQPQDTMLAVCQAVHVMDEAWADFQATGKVMQT